MLIVYDRPGQLANQLWAFTNIISIARECRSSVIIVMSRAYLDELDADSIRTAGKIKIFPEDSFSGKRIKWLTGFALYGPGNGGLMQKMLHLFPLKVITSFVPEEKLLNEYREGSCCIINSWEMRQNHICFGRQSSFIRHLIQPAPIIKRTAEKQMQEIGKKGTIVVGVHIRRGDYNEFMGGKYYFDDATYLRYMQKMQDLLSPYKVKFRIFSHEPVELKNFPGLDIYFSRELPAVGDLWAMSFCNLILGPVSTFSMWASFWGQAPLYFITAAGSDLSLHSFKRVIAQDTFSNNLPQAVA